MGLKHFIKEIWQEAKEEARLDLLRQELDSRIQIVRFERELEEASNMEEYENATIALGSLYKKRKNINEKLEKLSTM